VAAEAWVTRAEGQTVIVSEAWVSRVAGLAATAGEAWVSRVSGTSDAAAAALVLEVRGIADKSALAPIVAIGGDHTSPAGAKVHLTCSATAQAGATITGYTWRVVSKSANAGTVVFDNPAVQSPSFRAPLRRKSATYTIGVSVTDSTGRVSPEATCTITIEQAELLAATTAGWQPIATEYAVNGGWT
jgi:hypothetical protein